MMKILREQFRRAFDKVLFHFFWFIFLIHFLKNRYWILHSLSIHTTVWPGSYNKCISDAIVNCKFSYGHLYAKWKLMILITGWAIRRFYHPIHEVPSTNKTIACQTEQVFVTLQTNISDRFYPFSHTLLYPHNSFQSYSI